MPDTRRLTALALAALLTGCVGASDSTADDPATDTLAADSITRRQRDSVIGGSNLPGAGVVNRALDASDAIDARNAALDSLSGGP